MEYALLTFEPLKAESNELLFSLSRSFSANLRRLNEERKKERTLDFILADILDAFGFTGTAAEMLQLNWGKDKNLELRRRALNKSVELFCKIGEYFEANLICRSNWNELNDIALRKNAHYLNEKTIREEYEMTKKARESLKELVEDAETKEVREFLKVGDLFSVEGTYGMARHYYSCAYSHSKVLLERKGIKESETEKIKNLMIEACYGESRCYEKMGMLNYALNTLNMYMPKSPDNISSLRLEYEKERLSKKWNLFSSFEFFKIMDKEQGNVETKQASQAKGLKDGEKEVKMGNLIIEKF